MFLWTMQMALNWLWSHVFFLAHQPGKALIIITLLLITVLLFIFQSQKHDKSKRTATLATTHNYINIIVGSCKAGMTLTDKMASWLFIPYALWIGFATILNASIYWLN